MPCIHQNGVITGYNINYTKPNSEKINVKQSNGDVRTFEITGLEPSTEYEIAVAAVTVAGRGPFTDTSLKVNTTGDFMPYTRTYSV